MNSPTRYVLLVNKNEITIFSLLKLKQSLFSEKARAIQAPGQKQPETQHAEAQVDGRAFRPCRLITQEFGSFPQRSLFGGKRIIRSMLHTQRD